MKTCRGEFRKNEIIKFDDSNSLVSGCRNKKGIIESVQGKHLSIKILETGKVFSHFTQPNNPKISKINIRYND